MMLPEKWSKAQLQRRLKNVSQNLRKSLDNREARYNQFRKPVPFKEGDRVYYKNHPISKASQKIAAKLMLRYRGPFEIARFLTPARVSLVDPDTKRFVTRSHVSLLKQGTVCQG